MPAAEPENAGRTDPAPERFSTVLEIQETHDALLGRSGVDPGVPDRAEAFWTEVAEFARRTAATGAWLDLRGERRLAQGILDYWAATLYRADRPVPTSRLADFDPGLAPELPEDPCPYQGLAAFDRSRHGFFFGREALIRRAADRLSGGARFLAVVGESGSGKSSLVLAGLAPALEAGQVDPPGRSRVIALVPGHDPPGALATALAAAFPSGAGPGRSATDDQRGSTTSPPTAAHVLRTVAEPVVLVVDQFEEVFTLAGQDGEEREAFIAQLLEVTRSADRRDVVIVTMRSEYRDNVARLPELHALLKEGQIEVGALDVNELRAAIEEPARRVGLRFDEGIVDSLVTTILGERAGLPLLQFALLKLWRRRERNRITARVYREVGDPREALGRSADAFYTRLIPELQTAVRGILLKLVRPDLEGGREFTSSRVLRSELFEGAVARPRVEEALRRLVAEGLLKETPGRGGADPQVEVAHEALVRNWRKLADWLEAERVGLWRRRILRDRALAWREGRASLLRDRELDEAEAPESLTGVEAEFVAASREAADHERREAEEAHVREIERQIRELNRERDLERVRALAEAQAGRARDARRAAILLGGLLLLSVGAMVAAVWFGRAASRNARIAETNAVRAEANRRQAEEASRSNRTLAYSNELLAHRSEEAAELARVANTNLGATNLILEATLSNLHAVSAIMESQNVQLARRYTQLQSSEAAGREVLARLRASESARTRALFASYLDSAILLAREGSLIEAAEAIARSRELDGNTNLAPAQLSTRNLVGWFASLRSASAGRSVTGTGYPLRDVAVSHDRRWLAVVGENAAVALFDVRTGEKARQWDALPGGMTLRGVVFGPGGAWLATAGDDPGIARWTIPEGLPLTGAVQRASAPVVALAASGDGRRLAAGGRDGYVKVWSAEAVREAWEGPDAVAGLASLAFDETGRTLAVVSARGRLVLIDFAAGRGDRAWRMEGWRERIAFEGAFSQVALHPDGRRVATGCEDGTIQLWERSDGRLLRTLRGHRGRVSCLALAIVGGRDLLISGGWDRVIRVWDLVNGETVLTGEGHTAAVTAVVTADDRIHSVANDGTWREWRLTPETNAVPRVTVARPEGGSVAQGPPATSCAWAPDGSRLVIGHEDGTLGAVRLPGGEPAWPPRGDAHRGRVTRLAVDPAGQVIASVGFDGRLKLWNLADGRLLDAPSMGDEVGALNAVAFGANGGSLALAGLAASGVHLEGSPPAVATEGTGLVGWMDREHGRIQWRRAHGEQAHSVAFDRSGGRCLSAGEDGRVLEWEVNRFGKGPREVYRSDGGPLAWAAYSPTGDWIAAAGRDGRLVLIDAATGRAISRLSGHQNTILRLVVSPDGAQVLTASADGSVRAWDATEHRELWALRLPVAETVRDPLLDFGFLGRAAGGESWLAVPLATGETAVYRLGRVYP